MKTNNKTRKNKKSLRNIPPDLSLPIKSVYSENDYQSNDGMLTSVWGPSMWHYLHTMSFNYPVHPSCLDKAHYRNYIIIKTCFTLW